MATIELSKRNQYAAAAFVALLGLAFLVGREPTYAPAEKPSAELMQIDPTKLDRMVITRDGGKETIELTKGEDAKWAMTKPVAYAVNAQYLSNLFDKLAAWNVEGLEAETNANHAAMEVDDAKGVKVELFGAGAPVAALIIGKTVKTATMFRKVGEDKVWRASGALRSYFDKPARDWRDKAIYAKFEITDAMALHMKHAESTVTVAPAPATATPATAAPGSAAAKTAAASAAPATAATVTLPAEELLISKDGDNWVFEQPVGAPLDKTQVEQLVRALSTATAFDFADGKTFEETGLNAPKLEATVTLASGGERTLLVGALNGDDYYVGTPGSAQVFTMKKYVVERLFKRAKDFEPKAPAVVPTPGSVSPTPGMPGLPPGVTLPPGMKLPPGMTMPSGPHSMVPPGMPPTAMTAVGPGVPVGPKTFTAAPATSIPK
jgi:hypothetical protein